jgi:ribonucleoside-diphosphate reductase beta chain
MTTTSIFEKRVAFKPYEFPEVMKYGEAISHSYWLVSEWNFLSDIHDFNVKLNDVQRNVVKNTLLAISQIEVAVKKFWVKLGDRFPKAEFEMVGIICGESECRHASGYAHLLEVLNLNNDFNALSKVPAIQGRVDYLSKYLKSSDNTTDKNYLLTLTLFSIFIENVSLFSQFVIIQSFNKYMNVLKDIDNVIQATQKEEQIHALLGIYLINEIKKEHPEWFSREFYHNIEQAAIKAFNAECGIIDWIFEKGELEFLSKDVLKEFLKDRFNESIKMIGGLPPFEIDQKKLTQLRWFNDEIYAEVNTDFFHKRPVSYSKKTQAIQAEDLF